MSDTAARLIEIDDALSQLGWPIDRKRREQLWRLCREGHVPHVKLGRRVYFNPGRLAELAKGGGDAQR